MSRLRLWLVGDDEVLDILAELSRHLDYFEVSRVDEPPPEPTRNDHIVISFLAPERSLVTYQSVKDGPAFATLVSLDDQGDSPGARAIETAAMLVMELHAHRRQQN